MVDALIGDVEKPEDVGIHYFLLDACVTFLGWPALFPVPPRGGAAPALMNYLVSNISKFLPCSYEKWMPAPVSVAQLHGTTYGFSRRYGCTIARQESDAKQLNSRAESNAAQT